MNRVITFFIVAVFTVSVTSWANAQCAACDNGCAACAVPTCSSAPCRAAGRCCGGPTCVGKAERVDVEKHCWKIECEDICVPAVRFPWEHGGSKLTLFTLFNCKKGCGKTRCRDSRCDGNCAAAPCVGCADGCTSCVPPKCGLVKKVRDLKKESYKVKECEYSLSAGDNNGNGGNGAGCDCAGAGCDSCAGASHATQSRETDSVAPVNSRPVSDGYQIQPHRTRYTSVPPMTPPDPAAK